VLSKIKLILWILDRIEDVLLLVPMKLAGNILIYNQAKVLYLLVKLRIVIILNR
jgi:hypothetical protein